MNFFDIIYKISDASFKFHTIPRCFFAGKCPQIRQGCLNGVGCKVDRDGKSLFDRCPADQSTGEYAGENVTGAMHWLGNMFPIGGVIAASDTVVGNGTVLIAVSDTGNDGDGTADFCQLFQICFHGFQRTLFRIGNAQQQGNFCQVRGDNIGFPAELSHFHRKIRCEAGVHAAGIAHDRINHNDRIFAAERIEKVCHDLYLFSGSQIAGVNAVEMQL